MVSSRMHRGRHTKVCRPYGIKKKKKQVHVSNYVKYYNMNRQYLKFVLPQSVTYFK